MHVPCDGVTELSVAAPATDDVSSTPCAGSCPVFLTVALNAAGWPTRASGGAVTVTPTLARAGGTTTVVVGLVGAPFAQFASKFPVHVSFTVTELGRALSPRLSVITKYGSPEFVLRLRPVRSAVPVESSSTGAMSRSLKL